MDAYHAPMTPYLHLLETLADPGTPSLEGVKKDRNIGYMGCLFYLFTTL